MGTSGIIGGTLAYSLLRVMGRRMAETDGGAVAAYQDRSKLEALFGPRFWDEIAGRTVIDFGCGTGDEAIELAQRGARRVVGIDIREDLLDRARESARRAGVHDRCVFATHTDEPGDLIVTVDTFEHFADPAAILSSMRSRLAPGGKVVIAFGPPWLHPLGGHLFSVFPWAHLVFTERALIRWRSDFKSDGATRFEEVAGGLNRMTVGRFVRLIRNSGFLAESFETVPIRRLRRLAGRLTREFTTSVVRCTLVDGAAPAGRIPA